MPFQNWVWTQVMLLPYVYNLAGNEKVSISNDDFVIWILHIDQKLNKLLTSSKDQISNTRHVIWVAHLVAHLSVLHGCGQRQLAFQRLKIQRSERESNAIYHIFWNRDQFQGLNVSTQKWLNGIKLHCSCDWVEQLLVLLVPWFGSVTGVLP